MFSKHFMFTIPEGRVRAEDKILRILRASGVLWPRSGGFRCSDDIRNADRELARLRPFVKEGKGAKLLDKMVRWFSQRGRFATLPEDISTRIFSEFVQMVTPKHVFPGKKGRAYVAHAPEMYFVIAMWKRDLEDCEARVRATIEDAYPSVVKSVATDLFHLYCKLEALAILVYHMVAWICSLFV